MRMEKQPPQGIHHFGIPDRREMLTKVDDCLDCAACCHHIVVRITKQDLVREPTLGAWAVRETATKTWRLVPYQEGGRWRYTCPLLAGNICSIYETRPSVCQAFRRGSPECRQARARAGKGAVKP